MGGFLPCAGVVARRHGHDPENLDDGVFGKAKLMFVPLYRACRISNFENVTTGCRMADVEEVDVAGLCRPTLSAPGAVALTPTNIGDCDPLLMAASVTIEAVAGVALRIAVEALPAEPSGLSLLALDETGLATHGNGAGRNPFNEGELTSHFMTTRQAISAVMAMPGIPAEPS